MTAISFQTKRQPGLSPSRSGGQGAERIRFHGVLSKPTVQPKRRSFLIALAAAITMGVSAMFHMSSGNPPNPAYPPAPETVSRVVPDKPLSPSNIGRFHFYAMDSQSKQWVSTPATTQLEQAKNRVQQTLFRMLKNRPDVLAKLQAQNPFINLYTSRLNGGGGRTTYQPYGIHLALYDLEYAYQHPQDGYHIVIHEGTHLIDALNDNGAPPAPDGLLPAMTPDQIQRFIRAREIEKGRMVEKKSFMGTYPLENGNDFNHEFLAVAVENFFERGHLLKKHNRALYKVFREYFKQDPAASSGNTP